MSSLLRSGISLISSKNSNILKRFASNKSLLENPKQEEIQIPVPWGNIAGLLMTIHFDGIFLQKVEHFTDKKENHDKNL